MPESYDWIYWLRERDAQVLLLTLMQGIEQNSSHDLLLGMVQGWRKNALKALAADDWTAQVDGYLEVRVDARLTALQLPMPDEDDADKA